VQDEEDAYNSWSYQGSCESNNQVWLVGGLRDLEWEALNNVGAYSPGSNSWDISCPGLNKGRVYLAAVGNSKHIFALGGCSQTERIVFNNVERLDPSGGTSWVNKASMPKARVYGAAVIKGDFLYYIGGTTDIYGSRKTTGFWRYNIAQNRWDQTLKQLPVSLAGISAALAGNKIYMPGDYGTANTYVYDIENNLWDKISPSNGIQPAQHYNCIAVENNIWRIGGIIRKAASNAAIPDAFLVSR